MELRGRGLVLFVVQALLAAAIAFALANVVMVLVTVSAGLFSPIGDVHIGLVIGDQAFLLVFEVALCVLLVSTTLIVQRWRWRRRQADPFFVHDDPRLERIIVEYLFALTLAEAIGYLVWCALCLEPHLPNNAHGYGLVLVLLLASGVGLSFTVRQTALSRVVVTGSAAVLLVVGIILGLDDAVFLYRPALWLLLAAIALVVRRSQHVFVGVPIVC